MVRKAFLSAMVLALGLSLAAAGETEQKSEKKKTVLTVNGMTCGSCVTKVKGQLDKTEGVLSAEVDLKKGEATVEYDPAKIDPEKIAAVASETGFKVKVKEEKPAEAEKKG